MVSLRDQTIAALRQQVAQLAQERDWLKRELTKVINERDEARAQVAEHGAILRQSSPYEVNRLRALLRECVAALRVGASPGDLETRLAAALEGRDASDDWT